MTKFLIAILVVLIGLNLIIDDAIMYKFDPVDLALQNCKDASEKEDCKSSNSAEDKKFNEDKFYDPYITSYAFFAFRNKFSFSLETGMPLPGFVEKPYTPPDLC